MRKLTGLQKDSLKEMGNIGAGSAATALSQLLGKDIKVIVPEVSMMPVVELSESFGREEKIVAAVYLRIFGEIKARVLMLFPQEKVLLLIDLLMKRKLGETREFNETEQSALKEIGNIIISSYLNALSKFIGMNSVPSVPALAVDMPEAIFQTVSSELAGMSGEALMIKTVMEEETTRISNDLFLIPEEESMDDILKALDNTVKGV